MSVNTSHQFPGQMDMRYQLPAEDPNKSLKMGIWLYFFFLLFEGALRKWFLPSLATPLLIIRDPIALWLLLSAWYKGLLPYNWYVIAMAVICLIAIATALTVGHGNFW